MEDAAPFRILLAHDGELAFVADLLREFGAPFEERQGATSPEDRQSIWNVVVANTTRMRELPANSCPNGSRIAIMSEDSRTLRTMLKRLGVDLMVRRPVHPAAFRLLLLHSLYRGPERRKNNRASVGGAIRIRVGMRSHPAILLDLSHTGCRIIPEVAIAPGKRLKIQIPPELAGGQKLVLKGGAVRTETITTRDGARKAVGIAFDTPKRAALQRLNDLVARHSKGPAMMPAAEREGVPVPPEQTVVAPVSTTSVAPPRPRRPRPMRDRVTAARIDAARSGASAAKASEESRPDSQAAESAAEPCEIHEQSEASQSAAELSGAERRTASRHSFGRRVIVLSDEAARVLLGRDLAAGGMRVDADPNLAVGDRLRIALHVRSGEVPIVVQAKVLRDDGERGMVLTFEGLNDTDRSYLQKMVSGLPVMSGDTGEGDASDGVVVTEILERN